MLWTYVISDLKCEEIFWNFWRKRVAKTKKPNQKQFRVKKLIKRKGDKLYLQWKGYDSSFNSWIDKKGIV